MFAGHLGAALAIGRAERRLNVAVLVVAALLLDIALWAFVLVGWERVVIPATFSATHQPEFVFPLSHGLAAGLAWAMAAGLAVFARGGSLDAARGRAAILVAAAVFSHWALDALVHRPELPLIGAGSALVGLGLWNRMTLALAVEAGVLLGGLALFLRGAPWPGARKTGLAALSVVVLVFTAAGMTLAPPPPSATAMASSSLVTLAVVCVLAWWLARSPGSVPPRKDL